MRVVIWEKEKKELMRLAGLKQINTGRKESISSILKDLLQFQEQLPYYRNNRNM